MIDKVTGTVCLIAAGVIIMAIMIVVFDSLDVIDAWALNWEAFATLVGAFATLLTGLAAVGGAVWIGSRQVKLAERQTDIQDRQADILDRQVRLQELALNSELYSKRMEVYRATEDYISAAMRNGRYPEEDIQARFYECLASSHFIFKQSVHQAMRDLMTLTAEMNRLQRATDRLERGDDKAKLNDALDKHENVYLLISEYTAKLPAIFSELRLVVEE